MEIAPKLGLIGVVTAVEEEVDAPTSVEEYPDVYPEVEGICPSCLRRGVLFSRLVSDESDSGL